MDMQRDLAKQAELIQVSVPVQQIIINGQPQTVNQTVNTLVCPKCKETLQSFDPGISHLDIIKQLSTEDPIKQQSAVYCQKCGQKIRIFRDPIIDLQVEMRDNI